MDVQTVTVVIAGISVVIGVVNSMLSSRRAEKQRQTEMFMEMYRGYVTRDHIKARVQFTFTESKKDVNDWSMETRVDFAMVSRYFEGIGVLLRRGLIDGALVHELLAVPIIRWWEKAAPIIRESRQRFSWPSMWDHAEFLYQEMKKYEQASPLHQG